MLSEQINEVFREIEQKISSGLFTILLPDSTSFLKMITNNGFESRERFFSDLSIKISGKLNAETLVSFNVFDLSDVVEEYKPVKNDFTEEESEKVKEYLKAYGNVAMIHIMQKINSSEMDESEVDILKKAMNFVD